MVTYRIEYAKSARSSCKKCKSKIENNALRVGVVSMMNDHEMVKWHHASCLKKPRNLKSIDDLEGLEDISNADAALAKKWVKGDIDFIKGEDDEESESAESEEEEETSKKRKRKQTATKSNKKAKTTKPKFKIDKAAAKKEEARYNKLSAKYKQLKVNDLKDMLKANDQPCTGNKGELVDRIVDGKMFGTLPRCPTCTVGILKVTYPAKFGHKGQGEYKCPGFFDDEGAFKRCSHKSDHADRIPWKKLNADEDEDDKVDDDADADAATDDDDKEEEEEEAKSEEEEEEEEKPKARTRSRTAAKASTSKAAPKAKAKPRTKKQKDESEEEEDEEDSATSEEDNESDEDYSERKSKSKGKGKTTRSTTIRSRAARTKK